MGCVEHPQQLGQAPLRLRVLLCVLLLCPQRVTPSTDDTASTGSDHHILRTPPAVIPIPSPGWIMD